LIIQVFKLFKINNFVDDIVANNPGLASTYNAGSTLESRLLKVVVLKTASSSRAIWIGTFLTLYD